VLAEGRISLKVMTEVSDLSTENAMTLQVTGSSTSLTVPSIQTRRADTTVEIPSGGSLALAGMIQEQTRQAINGIPALMQVPVLGALFKSRDYVNHQSELMVLVTPYVVRIMRASMIEVLESDYVEMARLKGLPERTVIVRHALPNALGPTFQVIAINLAYLAGGVIVVEYVFNYAGIGGALRDAVSTQDLPVVQALAMLIAAVYVVLNLMADIATILVTPRLRTRL